MLALRRFLQRDGFGRALTLLLMALVVQLSICMPILAQGSASGQYLGGRQNAPNSATSQETNERLRHLEERLEQQQAMQLELLRQIALATGRQQSPPPPDAAEIDRIVNEKVKGHLEEVNAQYERLKEAEIDAGTSKEDVDAFIAGAKSAAEELRKAVDESRRSFEAAMEDCDPDRIRQVLQGELTGQCVQAAIDRLTPLALAPGARMEALRAFQSPNPGGALASLWSSRSQDIQAAIVDALVDCSGLPDCAEAARDAASDLIETGEYARAQQEAMSQLLTLAMMTGNPYIIAGAFLFALFSAIFDGGGGDGEGDGNGRQDGQGHEVGDGNGREDGQGHEVGGGGSIPPGLETTPGDGGSPPVDCRVTQGSSRFEISIDDDSQTVAVVDQQTGVETAYIEFKNLISNVDGKRRDVKTQSLRDVKVYSDGVGISFTAEVGGEGRRSARAYPGEGSASIIEMKD